MWENLLCFILKIGIKMWWALLGKKVGSKVCGFQLICHLDKIKKIIKTIFYKRTANICLWCVNVCLPLSVFTVHAHT